MKLSPVYLHIPITRIVSNLRSTTFSPLVCSKQQCPNLQYQPAASLPSNITNQLNV